MKSEKFTEILELEREFNAPIERVFAAWTKPEILAEWFGPESFQVVSAEVNCTPKGSYDISIQSPDNNVIRHFGEYIEVDEPNTLIFTWELENQACVGSVDHCVTTVVELNFISHDKSTTLRLKHEKLPDQSAYDGHKYGWLSSLDCLQSVLGR